MNEKARAHQKLGEALEALDQVDGITVEESHIDEMQTSNGQHPIEQMLGMGQPEEPETEQVIHLIATLDDDGPKQEHPDEPDFDDEESVDIEIGDSDEAETRELRGDSRE